MFSFLFQMAQTQTYSPDSNKELRAVGVTEIDVEQLLAILSLGENANNLLYKLKAI